MSVAIPVQKDIGEYEEKVALGMSSRSLGFVGAGAGLSALEIAVMWFCFGLSADAISLPVMATMGLAFAAGFFTPLGLNFEDAVPLLLRQNGSHTAITYRSSAALALDEEERERNKGKKSKDALQEEKQHAAELKGRYERSPELLLPRYYNW